MSKNNWILNCRTAISKNAGGCYVLHLEKGVSYQFDIRFGSWFDALATPRDEESILSSLPCPREESQSFLNRLVNENILASTDEASLQPQPALGGTELGVLFEAKALKNADARDWQNSLVFATSALLSL